MDNNATTICVNGELKPGDLVLSTPDEDYACLIGTVLSISKLGTPEHAAETENDTDGVHVNFMDSEYSDRRIAEIEEMFSDLYGYPKPFAECPIDDTIMSPDTLIRITGVEGDLMKAILESRVAAEALCELVKMGPGIGRDIYQEQPTPAQAALHEPDAFDDPGTASLRLELIERLDENLSDYFDTLRGLDGQEIADMSSEIGAKMDAHYYLSEIHNFRTSEVEYLLQFQNPLEVAADEFLYAGTDERSDIMWKIFDRQDALEGDYPLVNDESPTSTAPKQATPVTRDELLEQIAKKHCRFETLETRNRDSLDFREVSVWGFKAALEEAFAAGVTRQMERSKGTVRGGATHTPDISDEATRKQELSSRLDKNLSDYCESLLSVDKRELIGIAEEIAARYAAREYMKTGYDYKTGEIEYLLQFQDPLALVADGWPGTLDGLVPMDGVVSDILKDRGSHRHYSRVLNADSPAAEENARDASTEKRSVLEQIREAAKAPREPHKNKETRNKSGPEL